MEEKVSLYSSAGRLTESDVNALQPGDTSPSLVLAAGRAELPSGQRYDPERQSMELMRETSTLSPKERMKKIREAKAEKRPKKVKARHIRGTETIRTTAQMWRNAAKPGATIGYIMANLTTNEHILSAGPIQIGSDSFIVGVVVGRNLIYLGRLGAVQLLSGSDTTGKNPKLKAPVVDPRSLSDGEKAIWADAICRQVMDLYTTRNIIDGIGSVGHRYQTIVRAYLDGAVVDCAAAGVERTRESFIHACDRTWTEMDMFSHAPTIKHALYVSLALSLEPDQAVQLIETAGFIELQLGVFQRETAMSLYLEARRNLAQLCPQWYLHKKATDWATLDTSVAELFKLQFARLVNDAHDRGLPLEAAAGLRISMTQLGQTPLAGSYINRTFKSEVGREALKTLRRIQKKDD